jgi:nucleotide-binding universal stress UspA family protein
MIPTYRKVLATTDLSPTGNSAIAHAYAVLAGRGGTVILWHAIDMSGIPSSVYAQRMPGKPLAEQRAGLRDSLFSSLEALVPEEARAEGLVTTEIRVVEAPGVIQEAICQEARTQEVDLIVMASHGHSGVKHLLLGSVAESVLKSANRPVLVVLSRE